MLWAGYSLIHGDVVQSNAYIKLRVLLKKYTEVRNIKLEGGRSSRMYMPAFMRDMAQITERTLEESKHFRNHVSILYRVDNKGNSDGLWKYLNVKLPTRDTDGLNWGKSSSELTFTSKSSIRLEHFLCFSDKICCCFLSDRTLLDLQDHILTTLTRVLTRKDEQDSLRAMWVVSDQEFETLKTLVIRAQNAQKHQQMGMDQLYEAMNLKLNTLSLQEIESNKGTETLFRIFRSHDGDSESRGEFFL